MGLPHMPFLLKLCAALCIVQSSPSKSVPCTTQGSTSVQYDIAPLPSERDPHEWCFTGFGATLSCYGIMTTLSDGNVDQNASNFTFNQDCGNTVMVKFTFNSATQVVVNRANIYFLNEPSQGIGLPAVEASIAIRSYLELTPLETTILGNQDLSQDDSGLRNVSVVVTNDLFNLDSHKYFILRFRFFCPITTLVLSEVELCTDEVTVKLEPITFEEGNITVHLGPQNVSSSLDLSCTVTNEGRFNVTWTVPDGTTYHTTNHDATRTSILHLSRLELSDAGEYVCQASYEAALPGQGPSSTIRTVTLRLEGTLQPLEASVVVNINQSSVSLMCELYGYVSGEMDIIWTFEDGPQIANDSVYTVIQTSGDHMIQNGGYTPIPGVRSILSIARPTDDHTGTYFCSGGGFSKIITLSVLDPTGPMLENSTSAGVVQSVPTATPRSPTDATQPNATQPDRSTYAVVIVITGVVVGLMVGLLIAAAVLCAIMCCTRQQKEEHVYDRVTHPGAVPPELPPRKPSTRFPVNDNAAYNSVSSTRLPIKDNAAYNIVTVVHSRDVVKGIPGDMNPATAVIRPDKELPKTFDRKPPDNLVACGTGESEYIVSWKHDSPNHAMPGDGASIPKRIASEVELDEYIYPSQCVDIPAHDEATADPALTTDESKGQPATSYRSSCENESGGEEDDIQ